MRGLGISEFAIFLTFGVGGGIYLFKPYFDKLRKEKERKDNERQQETNKTVNNNNNKLNTK